jgi:hypothetical protein
MKIYLDDIRSNPYSDFISIKTAHEAIELIKTNQVTHISFDHDLGLPENGTGYDVAKTIEELAFNDQIKPIRWMIHSANPVGRTNIARAMMSAERYWGRYGYS